MTRVVARRGPLRRVPSMSGAWRVRVALSLLPIICAHVEVEVHAPWPSFPSSIAHEMGEGIARSAEAWPDSIPPSSHPYWSYIACAWPACAAIPPHSSQPDPYTAVALSCSSSPAPLDLNSRILHATVFTRVYSPATLTDDETVAAACPGSGTAAHVDTCDGRAVTVCNVHELEALKLDDLKCVMQQARHVAATTLRVAAPVARVVLFSNLTCTNGYALHAALFESKRVEYALRLYLKRGETQSFPTSTAGWGAVLDVKSTEYKFMDDRRTTSSAGAGSTSSRDRTAWRWHDLDRSDNAAVGVDLAILSSRTSTSLPRAALARLEALLRVNASSNDELEPWQVHRLGLSSSTWIADAGRDAALDRLESFTANVHTAARFIARFPATFPTVGDETSSVARLWVNGYEVEGEVDPLTLLKRVDGVASTHRRALAVGLQGADVERLLAHTRTPTAGEASILRLDVYTDGATGGGHVLYLNDVETAAWARGWPSSVQALQGFSGMGLHQVALNAYTVLTVCSPAAPAACIAALAHSVAYTNARIPIRFAVAFNAPPSGQEARDELDVGLFFAAMRAKHGDEAARGFAAELASAWNEAAEEAAAASGTRALQVDAVPFTTVQLTGAYVRALTTRRVSPSLARAEAANVSAYADDAAAHADWIASRIATSSHMVLLNGRPCTASGGGSGAPDLPTCIQSMVGSEMKVLQMLVATRALDDNVRPSIYAALLGHAMTRPGDDRKFKSDDVDLQLTRITRVSGAPLPAYIPSLMAAPFDTLEHAHVCALSAVDFHAAVVYAHAAETSEMVKPVTLTVVDDLSTAHGLAQAQAALSVLSSTPPDGIRNDTQSLVHKHLRVGILHTGEATSSVGAVLSYAAACVATHGNADDLVSFLLHAVGLALRHSDAASFTAALVDGMEPVLTTTRPRAQARIASFIRAFSAGDAAAADESVAAYASTLSKAVAWATSNRVNRALLLNDVALTGDGQHVYKGMHIAAMTVWDMSRHTPSRVWFKTVTYEGIDADLLTSATLSHMHTCVYALMDARVAQAGARPEPEGPPSFTSGPDEAPLTVTVAVDPMSPTAARVSAMATWLRDALGAKVRTYLLPASVYPHPRVAVRSYERWALPHHIAADGSWRSYSCVFEGLPQGDTLTLRTLVPEAWNIQPAVASVDTDNMRLGSVMGPVRVVYDLKSLVAAGVCSDARTSAYPNGLQLTLASASAGAGIHSDTLVMQNLGYFQLQASAGVWRLSLAAGRALDLYTLVNSVGAPVDNLTITVRDLIPSHTHIQVMKRPGMEGVSLLDTLGSGAPTATPASLWSTVSTMFGGGASSASANNDTIHVFSLASGHLYERFLRIMMLSVLKRTTSHIHFWLLENFLSPAFKRYIRHFANVYGCDVSFVSYKWPSWLRGQSEKQRLIWGYKILFLDVLFPLNVSRIIYIDSDQVVRSDIAELARMDLHGAPYAYTPFCDSRKETLGFQFWRQGFWAEHLQGKPYHISALYVVDLLAFRRYAVGDMLRAVYDTLSRDPNSLSNLDQDLPNYAQNMVPIHSLPQEWLWCESWCSDGTKASSKTIDLCNNPLHKEPKLDMAKRVISGPLFKESWVELDAEAASLEATLPSDLATAEPTPGAVTVTPVAVAATGGEATSGQSESGLVVLPAPIEGTEGDSAAARRARRRAAAASRDAAKDEHARDEL